MLQFRLWRRDPTGVSEMSKGQGIRLISDDDDDSKQRSILSLVLLRCRLVPDVSNSGASSIKELE